MDLKILTTVFFTVFLAELGDKTQIATLLYAANSPHAKLAVFVGATAALVLTSGLAVLGGDLVSQYADPRTLSRVAGIGFIVIGLWTLAAA